MLINFVGIQLYLVVRGFPQLLFKRIYLQIIFLFVYNYMLLIGMRTFYMKWLILLRLLLLLKSEILLFLLLRFNLLNLTSQDLHCVLKCTFCCFYFYLLNLSYQSIPFLIQSFDFSVFCF